MNNTRILTCAFACTLLLAACSKKDNDSPNNGASLPKTYTEDVTIPSAGNQTVTFNLTYDNQSRLTSMISTSDAGDKFLYTYPPGKNFSMDLYNSGAISIHENFFVNSQSHLDSTIQWNDTQDTSTEKYFYNASQQLTKVIMYDYTTAGGAQQSNITTYAYNANGDVTTQTDGGFETTFTYTDIAYNLAFIGPVEAAIPKHYIKTQTQGSQTLTHTYTFDSQNRLTMDKGVTNDGWILIKSYTY